jgi:hypothetical protein
MNEQNDGWRVYYDVTRGTVCIAEPFGEDYCYEIDHATALRLRDELNDALLKKRVERKDGV